VEGSKTKLKFWGWRATKSEKEGNAWRKPPPKGEKLPRKLAKVYTRKERQGKKGTQRPNPNRTGAEGSEKKKQGCGRKKRRRIWAPTRGMAG